MDKIKKTVYLEKTVSNLLETIGYERKMNYSKIVSEAIKNFATEEEIKKSQKR